MLEGASGIDDEVSLLDQLKKFFRAATVCAQNREAKIIVWYRIDRSGEDKGVERGEKGIKGEEEEWKELASFSGSYLTNAVNGDYFSYDAPFLKTIEDIKNLKIKLEARSGGQTAFTVYLDSVWVEAEFSLKKKKGESDILKLDEKFFCCFFFERGQ